VYFHRLLATKAEEIRGEYSHCKIYDRRGICVFCKWHDWRKSCGFTPPVLR